MQCVFIDAALDAKIVNNEGKCSHVCSVGPRAQCSRGWGMSVQSCVFNEHVWGNVFGLGKFAHAFVDLGMWKSIVTKLIQVVMGVKLCWDMIARDAEAFSTVQIIVQAMGLNVGDNASCVLVGHCTVPAFSVIGGSAVGGLTSPGQLMWFLLTVTHVQCVSVFWVKGW